MGVSVEDGGLLSSSPLEMSAMRGSGESAMSGCLLAVWGDLPPGSGVPGSPPGDRSLRGAPRSLGGPWGGLGEGGPVRSGSSGTGDTT